MTYHRSDIPKYPAGSLEKILEETYEAIDAREQGSHLLLGIELADTLLSLRQAATSHGWSLEEIERFADITERAFTTGRAQAQGHIPLALHTEAPTPERCSELATLLHACPMRQEEWVTYGTGHAALRRGDSYKLLVWDPRLVTSDHWGGIHSHDWDLESTVLDGYLQTTLYETSSGGDHTLQSCCTDTRCDVELKNLGQVRIVAGRTYYEPRGTLHRVENAQAVTWVRKLGRVEGSAHYIEEGLPNPYAMSQGLDAVAWSIVQESVSKALRRWL